MIADTLHRLHHDSGWYLIAALTLLTFGAALAVLSYTAGSPDR